MLSSTSSVSALRETAAEHLKAGRLEAAQTELEQLVRLAPEGTGAFLDLSNVLVERGHWRASARVLLAATQHLPRHAPLLLNLIQQLSIRGEVLAMRKCMDFLGQAPDPPAWLLAEQARRRYATGEMALAVDLFERALKAGWDAPGDLHNYAQALALTGAPGAACQALLDCLDRYPGHTESLWLLARMRKHAPGVNVAALIDRQLVQQPQIKTDQKVACANLENARFQLLDAAGRYEDAWRALANSNALMRQAQEYDYAANETITDELLKWGATCRSTARVTPAVEGPIPIFIVGLPRSGSTLLERMLSAHSQIVAAGELDDFLFQLHCCADVPPQGHRVAPEALHHVDEIDFEELGARYLRQTRWRAGAARYYIDKMPANLDLVPFIQRALPHARIIHLSRPAMDVCFSHLTVIFCLSPWWQHSHDQQTLAHYYQQHRRLVEGWQTCFPDAMREVAYTDIVLQPEETLRGILEWLDVPMESGCAHPEKSRALPTTLLNIEQTGEPIHTRSIDHWRNYAQHLLPLRKALGDTV